MIYLYIFILFHFIGFCSIQQFTFQLNFNSLITITIRVEFNYINFEFIFKATDFPV